MLSRRRARALFPMRVRSRATARFPRVQARLVSCSSTTTDIRARPAPRASLSRAGLCGAGRDLARWSESGRTRARFRSRKDRCDPLHCVPGLRRTPGTLRNGAPSKDWNFPDSLREIRRRLDDRSGGDRQMVEIPMPLRTGGIDAVEAASAEALSQNAHGSSLILNILVRRRLPPKIPALPRPEAPSSTPCLPRKASSLGGRF